MTQFAYEIREFGTDRLLGGGLSRPGAFASEVAFLDAESAALERLNTGGRVFVLRPITVAAYRATLIPPGHEQ